MFISSEFQSVSEFLKPP